MQVVAVIAILIVLYAIYSAIIYWKIVLPIIAVICFTIYSFRKIAKNDKEMEEYREHERQERERKKQEAEEKIKSERQEKEAIIARRIKSEQKVVELVNRSATTSDGLVNRITAAKSAIDSAEWNYADSAFAPFWDDVESAVTSLALFNTGVKRIAEYSAEYKAEIQELGSVPAVFDWDKAVDIPDAKSTADRLREIVRTAQKNFQFATIYEQRKTNQLLSIGFANLAQALNEIAWRIEESTSTLSMSISDLSQVVSETSAQAIEAGKQDAQEIVKGTQAIKSQMESDAKARQIHEEKETEFLTDMQKAYRRVHRDELEHKI